MLLEHREGVGEKADLVPHAERLHREERDPLLDADRLDPGTAVAAGRRDDRAREVGLLGRVDAERDAIVLDRQDAARVQHLGAARRDLLRFVVVERLEQPGVRDRARVRREHAGHVGPDLEPARGELRGEIAARGVGAAATEQHRVAVRVAGDEALRDRHLAHGGEALLEIGVGREVAGRRQVARTRGGARPFLGVQQLARIEPLHVDAFVLQVRGADARGHEFATRHHARTQAVAHLADQVDAFGAATQLGEVVVEFGGDVGNAQVARQVHVTALDLVHDRFPVAGQRFRQQLLEAVGDAGERRVDDDGLQPLRESVLDDGGDVLPVADARDAGAAELEDDPGGIAMACHRTDPAAPCRVWSGAFVLA